MRRTFPFCVPTLLFPLVIQILASLLLWLSDITIAGQIHAASSITQTTGPGDLGTIVTPNGNVYGITEGKPVGNNLFHSFAQFSVDAGDIAQFQTTTLLPNVAIHNILGRVTGQTPSSIFGTIDSASYFPGANLFLMNPNGVIFGSSATLNVGGSVAFTTADYLRLAETNGSNAGIFHAETTSTSLLTSALVAAFGFLGSNPAAISVQGSTFGMQPGQSISLVGGNQGFTSVPNGVTVTGGKLLAGSGQVNIASVASRGEILAGTLEQAPNINDQSFGNLGTIQITQSAIDVSGNGGGTVLIRGGQFVLDHSKITTNITGPGPVINGVESTGGGIDIQVSQNAVMQNGALIDASVTGNATPGVTYGGIHIKADQIKAQGIVDLDTGNLVPTVVQSTVAPGITEGNSGDIRLEANSILVKDFGQVITQTSGTGSAGNIMVKANQNLEVNGGGIIGSLSLLASGNAGNIELTSTHGDILVLSGATVTTQAVRSSGSAGSITVTAREGDVVLSGDPMFGPANIFTLADRGTGAIGGIQLTAKNLQLLNGSSIEADTFFGVNPVKPGNIDVALSGSLNLDGDSFISTLGRGPAHAADLNITAHDMNIGRGSFLSADTAGSGPGGQLNISTSNLQITNGGQVRSGSIIDPFPAPGETPPIPSGPGGTINIQGPIGPATSVLIDGANSGVFTNAVGTGAAGNTNITAQSVTIQNGGTISAATSGTAPSATGGSITVKTTDHVTMTNDASITASSVVNPKTPNSGIANAGNISINAGQQLDMRDHSSITTTTESKQANGGNIDIQAIDRLRLVNSTISTSVKGDAGNGGNISIDPNVVVLQGSNVTAQAFGGAGGNIVITTPLFLADASSRVNASSQFGQNGTVTIQSPTSNLSESLGTLPSEPSQAQSLLTQRCAALASGQASSFVVAGREQLPADPGGWLTSPLTFAALGESLATNNAVVSVPATMPITAHDTSTVSLRRLTPAGFLMATFAESEATGCRS